MGMSGRIVLVGLRVNNMSTYDRISILSMINIVSNHYLIMGVIFIIISPIYYEYLYFPLNSGKLSE